MTTDPRRTDLLIVGAGPTGLAAACDALRHGFTVRVIERRASRALPSKALVLHARTLEALEVMGCAAEMVTAGRRFRALHVRTSSTATPLRVDLEHRRWGDTRFPYWLSIPQYEVERILEARLVSLGGSIEWGTALAALEDRGPYVDATLTTPDGASVAHRASWFLGCDGGRSDTRSLVGLTLARAPVGVTFALADLVVSSDLVADEGHVVLSKEGLLLLVPMPGKGCWRVIAQVPRGVGAPDAAAWGALVKTRTGLDLGIEALGWNSAFDLTSGVAERFRRGRVFLLGDAAHVHSPVGGQGLNTGVQDAHNLVWKLALVQRGGLSESEAQALLDSYAAERRPIARRMVRATSIATRVLTATHPVTRVARGFVARLALRVSRVQDLLARGVGMLDLRSAGLRRLHNPVLADGARLHDRLDPLRPTLLEWEGRTLVVRPDRVVARPGTLPLSHAVTARGA